MITVRRSSDRGHIDHGWLDTYHTFSFGQYHDPAHMGFRALRVINEDVVRHGRGFGMHPHDNMEIITYILEGELAHKDSTGSAGTIRPGQVQRMSAGTGVLHSEANPSPDKPVHLLQIWIQPNERDVKPEYEERALPPDGGRLALVASPDGRDGSMRIHADASLLAGKFAAGSTAEVQLEQGRHAWVQVARGVISLDGHTLRPGDGAAAEDVSALRLTAEEDAELLVFDLA